MKKILQLVVFMVCTINVGTIVASAQVSFFDFLKHDPEFGATHQYCNEVVNRRRLYTYLRSTDYLSSISQWQGGKERTAKNILTEKPKPAAAMVLGIPDKKNDEERLVRHRETTIECDLSETTPSLKRTDVYEMCYNQRGWLYNTNAVIKKVSTWKDRQDSNSDRLIPGKCIKKDSCEYYFSSLTRLGKCCVAATIAGVVYAYTHKDTLAKLLRSVQKVSVLAH